MRALSVPCRLILDHISELRVPITRSPAQTPSQDSAFSGVASALRNVCAVNADPTDKYLQRVITFAQGSSTAVRLGELTEQALILAFEKKPMARILIIK